MKLLIPCMECFREFGKPSNEFSHVEFCNDGRYEITCSHGHKTITLLQQQKFEVLFEIGAHAIIDGYYREAISSFTSSLERFYEFCIRVFFEANSISGEILSTCWKQVSSQSERQFGAYIFLWTYCLKKCPKFLSRTKIELRNNVIHKGKIPTKEETLKYGNDIINIVRPNIRVLQDRYPEAVQKVVLRHLLNKQKETDIGMTVGTMSCSTIISLSNGKEKHHSISLEDSLENLQKWRQMITDV